MNWVELIRVKVFLENAGLQVPQPILRGLEMIEVAKAHEAMPPVNLLDLDDDGVRDRVTDMSIREHQGFQSSTRGMAPGIDAFTQDLLNEVRVASLPELDQLIVDLRPRFDETVAPLVVAAQDYGFTWKTTSDQVIELADEGASAAWRAARDAWRAVTPIVSIRKIISTAFNVTPTADDAGRMFFTPGAEVDYSVCFAAGESWSTDGAFYVDQAVGGQLDWFALALGGLRLNTPDEVRAKQKARATLLFQAG